MEKVREFLKKIPDWVKAVVASAVIIAVAVVVNDVVKEVVQRIADKNYVVSEYAHSIIKDITALKEDGASLSIQGWAVDSNVHNGSSSFELILQDTETGKALWPKMQENPDKVEIPEYFMNRLDCSEACFEGRVKTKILNEESVYEILLLYTADYIDDDGNKTHYVKTTSTGEYIYQGRIVGYDPKKFIEPDVEGTELEEIIKGGKICYFSECGLYIYKYNNSIYYIASPEFTFAENGLTEIPLHIYTIETEKLPEKSQQYGFENRDIKFERYEVTGWFGNYRVAIRELPTDYMVTCIRTGVYSTIDKEWVWERLISMLDK